VAGSAAPAIGDAGKAVEKIGSPLYLIYGLS